MNLTRLKYARGVVFAMLSLFSGLICSSALLLWALAPIHAVLTRDLTLRSEFTCEWKAGLELEVNTAPAVRSSRSWVGADRMDYRLRQVSSAEYDKVAGQTFGEKFAGFRFEFGHMLGEGPFSGQNCYV